MLREAIASRMPEPELPADLDVENVAVLVGDAVRYDYAVDALSERGLTYKTVAASLHTPTSFASMLSGQHPTQHGVYGFHQRLRTDDHLFGLDGYNAAFNDGETNANEWLARQQAVFGVQEQLPLDEVEPPFVWVDRDFGGHAPYNRYSNDGRSDGDISHEEYFKLHAGNHGYLRSEYAKSVDAWLERVDGMCETLADRDLLDDTLVVLMSDHGELLGEYGQVGHDYPAVPEIVYVPMTFVHPQIEPGLVESGVARHADLVPTVLDYLDASLDVSLPGSALQSAGAADHGICYYNRAMNDYLTRVNKAAVEWFPEIRFEIESVWDHDGGYAFNRAATHEKLLLYLFRTFVLPHGRSVIRSRSFKEAYDTLVPANRRYGTPGFTRAEAEAILKRELVSKVEGEYAFEFDEEAEKQLEDLGYL